MSVLRRDFLPADLKPHMDAANVAGAVSVQARQTLEETASLLEVHLLEKGLYELRLEMNTRPDWLPIPVLGIARLVEAFE